LFVVDDRNNGAGSIAGGWELTVTACVASAATPTPTPTPSPSPPARLLNIATRLGVQSGENVLIGGFILTGTAPKKTIVRAIGPSLGAAGVQGALADPTLELYNAFGQLLASNDNWKDSQQAELEATTIPPGNNAEAAIVTRLFAANNAYTAVVRGKNGTSGVALVEAYDLDTAVDSGLANISTRGLVETGENVMIGGLIVGPNGGLNAKVVVRAIGPSLGNFGIAGALQDPTLELVNSSGTVLRANNNWKDSQGPEIEAVGLHPSDDRESALVETVAPGAYTAIVRGFGNTTGVGLVEVYNVP
jgi:hypothetical protein